MYNITFGLLLSLLFQDSIYGTAEDSILLASLSTLQRKYILTFPRWKSLISFREKIWRKNISQTWQIFDWMLPFLFFLRPCSTFDLIINSFLTSFAMEFHYCLLQKTAVKFDPLNKLLYYTHGAFCTMKWSWQEVLTWFGLFGFFVVVQLSGAEPQTTPAMCKMIPSSPSLTVIESRW